jgi:ActR/RegA family two-component response regulator
MYNMLNMTVLVVDDDELFLRSVKRGLRGVVKCANSLELGMQTAIDWQPSVIVLDVHFNQEQLRGLDFIREFKIACPMAQVIVTTAFFDKHDSEIAIELGALSYAEKGDVAALRGLIEVALARVESVFVVPSSSWIQ